MLGFYITPVCIYIEGFYCGSLLKLSIKVAIYRLCWDFRILLYHSSKTQSHVMSDIIK